MIAGYIKISRGVLIIGGLSFFSARFMCPTIYFVQGDLSMDRLYWPAFLFCTGYGPLFNGQFTATAHELERQFARN
jgi:hypothetical protein